MRDTECEGFTINHSFRLSDQTHREKKIEGMYNPDSHKYRARHPKVHPDNFNEDGTSRLVYGTANGVPDSLDDFR